MDCASPMRSLIVALIFPTRRRWTVRFGRAEVRTKETADPTARRGRLSTSLCRKTLPGRVRGTADPSASPNFLSSCGARAFFITSGGPQGPGIFLHLRISPCAYEIGRWIRRQVLIAIDLEVKRAFHLQARGSKRRSPADHPVLDRA